MLLSIVALLMKLPAAAWQQLGTDLLKSFKPCGGCAAATAVSATATRQLAGWPLAADVSGAVLGLSP